MPRYVNPVPGGNIGRTDMGVDISAAPGTNILAIARERVAGFLQNWYAGQPYVWFQELGTNNQPTGRYNYVAEQIVPTVRQGQVVQAGQPIGRVAPSGTGLELGWAAPGGQTLAQAQGNTGGAGHANSPAGASYRAQVIAGGGASPSQSLSKLWIDAGGSPRLANIMAAIALAESGGNVGATNKNTNGSEDRGLWQINSSWSQFNAQQLLTDPLYNAKAAVAIQKQQGLSAWTTYTSGRYRQFMGQASTATIQGGGGGYGGYSGTRPGGDTTGGSDSGQSFLDAYSSLIDTPRTAPPGSGQDVALSGQDVSFWGTLSSPFKWYWGQVTNTWNEAEGIINGPATVINDTTSFLDFITKFALNPLMWLRAVEFVTGFIVMIYGLRMSSAAAATAVGDAQRITRTIIADTPIGREARMARGRRAGRHEGQVEHARLKARRETREREAARDRRRAGAS